MAEVKVLSSIAEVGEGRWNGLFPGQAEGYGYLLATELAGLSGFSWRYAVLEEGGKLLAAAPGFITEYQLETTLSGLGQAAGKILRRWVPGLVTLRLGCLGSPCTETALVGFDSTLSADQRRDALSTLLKGFEEQMLDQQCALMAVKDVPEGSPFPWRDVLADAGYARAPGLPIAFRSIDFETVDSYLATLSAGTRKDMRRKLKMRAHVRIEPRKNIDDVIDQIMDLYASTLQRADMTFEELTPEFFTGILNYSSNSFFVLYIVDQKVIAANLLIDTNNVLLDKFFVMSNHIARNHNIYFLSWFYNIEYCLSNKIGRFQAGQAAYANKVRLGCELIGTHLYFRHRNPIMNSVLKLIAHIFMADPIPEAKA